MAGTGFYATLASGGAGTAYTATTKDRFSGATRLITVVLNPVTVGTRAQIIGSCQCDDTGGKRLGQRNMIKPILIAAALSLAAATAAWAMPIPQSAYLRHSSDLIQVGKKGGGGGKHHGGGGKHHGGGGKHHGGGGKHHSGSIHHH